MHLFNHGINHLLIVHLLLALVHGSILIMSGSNRSLVGLDSLDYRSSGPPETVQHGDLRTAQWRG